MVGFRTGFGAVETGQLVVQSLVQSSTLTLVSDEGSKYLDSSKNRHERYRERQPLGFHESSASKDDNVRTRDEAWIDETLARRCRHALPKRV